MGRGGSDDALGTLLTELKQRSGLSYEQLGRRAHLSRSSVHRYCTGRNVPSAFAPIEAIATACRADRQDLARLYRVWERAEPPHQASPTETPAVEPDPPAAGPAATPPRRRARAALVATLAVLLLAGGSFAIERPEAVPTTTAISEPMWTRAPRAIDPGFVGVTAASDAGLMPSFPVGSVRLWDSETRWQNLEPARGQYDWTTLDDLVAGARAAGWPVVLTFGATPAWASQNGPRSVYPDGSRASPPDDLADWERFVRAVAQQYRGRIGAYELWDMANHPKFFSGSMAEMVEMTRRASKVIRAVDPAATVVCPSMGELWDSAALGKLREFAELGGYRHCDAAAVKLTARVAADPPETMLALADEIAETLHKTGTGIELWSTGTAYDVPSQQAPDDDRGAAYAVRFYLSGLYARYQRMYFYSWGSSHVPIVLQVAGGPLTKAAKHVGRLQQWLAGSRIHSCGQGPAAGLPETLWQCRFDIRGKAFLIWWTIDTTLEVTAAEGITSIERLDGSSEPVEAGEALTVTGSPVLLRV